MGILRRAALGAAAVGAAAGGLALASVQESQALEIASPRAKFADHVPPRSEQLRRLSAASAANPFDVLIIGGGATGTGCALDAVTRCVPGPAAAPQCASEG